MPVLNAQPSILLPLQVQTGGSTFLLVHLYWPYNGVSHQGRHISQKSEAAMGKN